MYLTLLWQTQKCNVMHNFAHYYRMSLIRGQNECHPRRTRQLKIIFRISSGKCAIFKANSHVVVFYVFWLQNLFKIQEVWQIFLVKNVWNHVIVCNLPELYDFFDEASTILIQDSNELKTVITLFNLICGYNHLESKKMWYLG